MAKKDSSVWPPEKAIPVDDALKYYEENMRWRPVDIETYAVPVEQLLMQICIELHAICKHLKSIDDNLPGAGRGW